MMRRAAAIALAALALAPAVVRAQFRARPMVIPVPWTETAVLAEPFATPRGSGEPDLADLLLARSGMAPSLRPHHGLLAPLATSPVAQPATFRCVAAGWLAENGSDGRPDVAYCAGQQDEIVIAFGDAPSVLRSYTHLLTTIGATPTLGFARLHPAPRQSDVLVLPVDTGRGLPNEGELFVLDFGTSAGAPAMVERSWGAISITSRSMLPDEVRTIRVSDGARARGIDDLYIPGFGSVTLYPNATPAGASTLAEVQLGPRVKLGGSLGEGLDPSSWLPAGVENNDILGAGALDVDGDGDLDLVVVLAPALPSASTPGKLLWIERTGDLAALATTPWRDLTADPALQPLVDPALLRGIELGGAPAIAVFDRGTDSVLVVTAQPNGGGLRVWRGGAAGRELRDLRLADVVGSPAPDLVADATRRLSVEAPDPAVLVWPDLGDASPEIAWSPGSPGTALRGEDLPLSVSARDPDGPFTVDWMAGDPYGPPAASSPFPPGAAVDVAWTVDGALLCDLTDPRVQVTARATDALGVFDDVSATLPVAFAPPSLAIAGAVPPGRLELPPGGTTATLEGSAWTRCGALVFAWGGSALAAAASVASDDGATTTRRILDLPESSYPALLAGDPVATLVATDPGAGLTSTATLAVALDARGLVEVAHEADVVELAPGELTVVRTRLRNRTSVSLPGVHVVDLLAGLAPAGEPRVTGAIVARTLAGGAEVELDALPPGSGVTIELPVRSLGGRSASAVEARSSGGHLLTHAASAGASDPASPGCGCGAGGVDLGSLLAVAAMVARRRRSGPRAAT